MLFDQETAAEPVRPPRRWTRYATAGAVILGLGMVLLVFRGCAIRPPDSTLADPTRTAEKPWATLVADVRRQPDLAGGRLALERLGAALAVAPPDSPDQPAGLTAESEAAARTIGLLNDADIDEVRPAQYSPFDPHYLAECLFLRDVVRGLDAAGQPPLRQAELAFAWVNRQVVDRPWVATDPQGRQQFMPPVPPHAGLGRGSGSGLDRAYVFLGLLQQLGLDGCWIGPPEAAQRTWSYARNPDGVTAPTGPMWAVGVRVGPDVFLFDPWRGEPVLGAGGQGVATLAEVRADPNLLKPWRDDKLHPWPVPAEDVKTAVPFLAFPLSGAAPRMIRLERELRAEVPPVRLATDPTALQSRFAQEAKLPGLKAWNPGNEAFTYPRALATFIPPSDGGYSPAPDLYLKYKQGLVPPTLFALPPSLRPTPGNPGVPEAAERLRNIAIITYGTAFLEPPAPLERLQRGQFAEVAKVLGDRRTEFQAMQARLRTDRNREATIERFAAAARQAYTQLLRARDRERSGPGPLTAEAQAGVANLWKTEALASQAVVDVLLADAGAAEATYLLALCLHEQAERAAVRAARTKLAADADRAAGLWTEAANWWASYAAVAPAQEAAFPGRAAHAKRLADRAAQGNLTLGR